MKNHMQVALTGSVGFIATSLGFVSTQDLDAIVTIIVQIVIGIATIYKLLKKNKNNE